MKDDLRNKQLLRRQKLCLAFTAAHTCGWRGRMEVAPCPLLCTRGQFGSDKAVSSH